MQLPVVNFSMFAKQKVQTKFNWSLQKQNILRVFTNINFTYMFVKKL